MISWLRQCHRFPFRGLALLFAGLLVTLPAAATSWFGTVVGVADGDTLTLLGADHASHRIRLDGIDAPERSQPFGQRARQSLAALAHGRTALADCGKQDRYGRTVCRVTIDGVDVGLEQVRRGLAWHYARYAHEQPAQVRFDYAQAERQARDGRIGLWTMPQPIAPWDYRRERSSVR